MFNFGRKYFIKDHWFTINKNVFDPKNKDRSILSPNVCEIVNLYRINSYHSLKLVDFFKTVEHRIMHNMAIDRNSGFLYIYESSLNEKDLCPLIKFINYTTFMEKINDFHLNEKEKIKVGVFLPYKKCINELNDKVEYLLVDYWNDKTLKVLIIPDKYNLN